MIYPKGYFLVLEGGEAVGKTTQVELLTAKLVELGHKVTHVRAPGGTAYGEDMRAIFKRHTGKIDPVSEVALLGTGKRELIEQVIKPALDRNEVVICDRFTMSTLVYQGRLPGMTTDRIMTLFNALGITLRAHRTIMLACDPETVVERLEARRKAGGEIDAVFDSFDPEFHRQLNLRYHVAYGDMVDMLHDNRLSGAITQIGTTHLNASEVHEQVLRHVLSDLTGSRHHSVIIERHAHDITARTLREKSV